MTPQQLEDMLIDFAVMVIDVMESLPYTKAGNHIGGQLIRPDTLPAPNYAEAHGAESRNDFIQTMKISLKELRETMVWLKIIARKRLGDCRDVPTAVAECGELIAIFTSSTKTADGGKRPLSNQKSKINDYESAFKTRHASRQD